MVAPGNGSLPRWAGSTNFKKAASLMLYWPRVLVWPARFACSLSMPRAAPTVPVRHIGWALVFQRLWQSTGCEQVIPQLLKGRRFGFAIERAILLTVLHRPFDPGNDRAADKRKESYQIDGSEDLPLHHLDRHREARESDTAKPGSATGIPGGQQPYGRRPGFS